MFERNKAREVVNDYHDYPSRLPHYLAELNDAFCRALDSEGNSVMPSKKRKAIIGLIEGVSAKGEQRVALVSHIVNMVFGPFISNIAVGECSTRIRRERVSPGSNSSFLVLEIVPTDLAQKGSYECVLQGVSEALRNVATNYRDGMKTRVSGGPLTREQKSALETFYCPQEPMYQLAPNPATIYVLANSISHQLNAL